VLKDAQGVAEAEEGCDLTRVTQTRFCISDLKRFEEKKVSGFRMIASRSPNFTYLTLLLRVQESA